MLVNIINDVFFNDQIFGLFIFQSSVFPNLSYELILEILGYVASILVFISLTMKNILKLRLINLIGSIFFTIYGVLINAYPVAFVNGLIAITNIYFLNMLIRREDTFELLLIEPESSIVKRFIEKNIEDIDVFFPKFDFSKIKDYNCVLIFRNLNIVGLFLYEIEDKCVLIKMDYVVKEYRDFKNAHFLFANIKRTIDPNLPKCFKTYSNVPIHQKYLRKMNFKRNLSEPDLFEKVIDN